ncbi:iron ABC transporter permease [Paenibacillus sp. GSMTC-2017]|uniref:FecCD family ABC transporter permease n=1 Tax=Paenibacillus sp. GSMTC-2017 TaxID=2794350 RepID=UPI0018D842E3|nr:iron ABC transporter permease [Paenibacillus sp. GSMTC-2017]MBH5319223.1 iron ABC transporter permease [Paenibacillus sp. GSMTC-2017]
MGQLAKGNLYRVIGLFISVFVLVVSFLCSIKFGFYPISWQDIIHTFTNYDSSNNEQIVVRTARLPRALIATAVGASLALAGAILQAVTRNAMASPSILGINAGASVAIVFAITMLKISDVDVLTWIAFAGAAMASVCVYVLGSMGKGSLSPLKIILAGAAMTAFFSAGTQGMLVLNENGLQDVMFWLAGSIAGRTMESFLPVLPYLIIGGLGAVLMSRQWNVLLMGEESAKGLGQNIISVKIIAALLVVLLAGGSVAVSGPIGLVGIIVPHIARKIVGLDYRWLIPYSALFGAILLLLADIAARFISFPLEVPVGLMTAAIGAPFFIYLARKGMKKK